MSAGERWNRLGRSRGARRPVFRLAATLLRVDSHAREEDAVRVFNAGVVRMTIS